MASLFTGSIVDSTDLIARGLELEFRAELRARFTALAEPLIEEAAKAAARNVVDRVETFQRIRDGTTEVHVRFNGKDLGRVK